MMTKELHQNLEKYESIFRTAIDSNYYRAMDSRFAAEFIKACKELNVYINTSCPQCVLRALQTVGKLYFDYQEPVKQSNQLKIEFPEEQVNDKSSQSWLPPTIPSEETIKSNKKASQNANKLPKKTNKK